MRRRISPPIANDIARIFPESILNLGLCQPAQQIMTSIIGRPQYIYRQVDYRLPFFGRRQPLGTSSTSEYIIALHPNIDIIRRPHREAGWQWHFRSQVPPPVTPLHFEVELRVRSFQ